ncbi:MAG: ATP-grasp domain-containing protein [Oscillospiraceae bacterium]|jgi:predicted ATP-grasp superfamily ATP-dependent carboligase|nr:ATP-grasp domain-containing protein [Oscillospiraceae bacterium]
MHVIVTDCHYRTTPALIRELASAGHTVTAVCEASHTPIGLRSRQAEHARLLPAGLSEIDYREELLDLCHSLGRPVLLPVGARTVDILARFASHFRPMAHFLAPTPAALEHADDKPTTAREAARLGIPVPAAFVPEGDEPLDHFARRLSYPVVLKYRCGEKLGLPAERRYTIARYATEFTRRYRTMEDVQAPVLVQEYIRGRGLGVSVLMDAQFRPALVFCHERLREYPVSGGPSTACRSAWFPALVDQAVALLRALRFSGFAMVEFKGTPGNARLLEINPRLWGSFPLACLCGAAPGRRYVDAACGVTPDPPKRTYATGVRMQYFFSDAAAALGYISRGRLDQAASFVVDSLSPRTKGGVFSAADWPGSLAYIRSLLRRPHGPVS